MCKCSLPPPRPPSLCSCAAWSSLQVMSVSCAHRMVDGRMRWRDSTMQNSPRLAGAGASISSVMYRTTQQSAELEFTNSGSGKAQPRKVYPRSQKFSGQFLNPSDGKFQMYNKPFLKSELPKNSINDSAHAPSPWGTRGVSTRKILY